MLKYIVCFSIAVSILFTSCKQAENETLHVGVMSSMDFVPLAVAQQKGFFDKHNVKVNIQKFYSANDRDAAFQSGNLDGTVLDFTGAILQKAGGVDLKITSACNAPFCIMTGPRSAVGSIGELKGKKVAVSRNTVIDFCIEMALKSSGLNAGDVEKQEINKIPIRLEMMMSGQTDATALPDPFISIALSKGACKIVCMDSLGYATTGIVFKTKAIQEKTRQLESFYRAYNDAVEYIQSHSIQEIYPILMQDAGFPESLLDSVQLPAYTRASMPEAKDLAAAVDWLKEKGLIAPGFQSDDLTDDRFITE